MSDVAGSRTRRALLLIDFQYDFLADNGRIPVARTHVEPVLATTILAIARAHIRGDVIIQIGNEFRPTDVVRNLLRRRAALAGTRGSQWDPRFAATGAYYLPKWRNDAFCNAELGRLLRAHQIGEVFLAGLFARACVLATARSARAHGLSTHVLIDAVACRSDGSRRRAITLLRRNGVILSTSPSRTANLDAESLQASDLVVPPVQLDARGSS